MSDFLALVYRHDSFTSSNSVFHRWMDDWTGRLSNLRFSTKNPGGFSECSFSLNVSYTEAFDIYGNYHHNYIRLEGGGGDIAWQGRIHEITPEPGQVSIVAYGMWSNAFDTIYDTDYFLQYPAAENPITNITGYVPISNTYQMLAQSFRISDSRAIQDIQLRLANFGVTEGSVVAELCSDNAGIPGTTIASRTLEASSIESSGFSEYLGLTTNDRLSANTTYWLKVRPGGSYTAGVSSLSGTHDGGNGVSYLLDNGTDFLSAGVSSGTVVNNTTDGIGGEVIDVSLDNLQNPSETVWFKDYETFNDISVVTDNDTGTYYTFSTFDYSLDAIEIGHSSKFGGIYVTVHTPQVNPTSIVVKYAGGGAWKEMDLVIDGTSVSGVPLAQSGAIMWKYPSDWPADHGGGDYNIAYWVRIEFASHVSTFAISEIDIGFTCKLDFSSLTFDTNDNYSVDVAVSIGVDTTQSYGDGKLIYYNGGTWYDYGADAIFYIWPHQKFNYYTGAVSTAQDVVEDALSYCHLLSEDDAIFRDTGIAAINPITFSGGEKPGDVIERVISFGSSGSTPEAMFAGVYERNGTHRGTSGTFHMRKMSQGRRWYIDISSLAFGQQGLTLSSSLDGMRTRTTVVYSDSVGSRSATPWISSSYFYDRFGYNRDGLFSIAGASEDVADLIAEVVAETYDRPQSKLDLLIDGIIFDMGMNSWPVWYLRAGDVLKIRNMFPSSSVLPDTVVDGISTVYVSETDYDAETGRMTVTPSDMNRTLLDIVLSLAGLGGGSIM
jgi:hypothetical protein